MKTVNWRIESGEAGDLLILIGDLRMQNAVEFYQAVLSLGTAGRPLRLDAAQVTTLHTAIFQILHALARRVGDFRVASSSSAFQAQERRMGLAFDRVATSTDLSVPKPMTQSGQDQVAA